MNLRIQARKARCGQFMGHIHVAKLPALLYHTMEATVFVP